MPIPKGLFSDILMWLAGSKSNSQQFIVNQTVSAAWQ